MAAKLLTERVSKPFAGASVVNEDAGTVDNVGVCGLVSENGRDYPLDMQRRDCAKYEGAKVMFDHSDEKTGRKFREWVGILRSPNVTASGSRARLELFKSDPNVPKLLEAIRKCPEKFGMSHVARCRTKRDINGREVVEAIESVESVDIVLTPATNPSGFFRHESKGRPVALSVKKLLEALVKHPKVTAKQVAPLKVLSEMDGMDDVPAAMDAPPADDADPADGVKDAFKSAILHLVDQAMDGELDAKEALSKIKKLMSSHGEVSGKTPAAEEPAEPEEPSEESKKPDPWAVLKECQAAGYNASPSELETLALQPDAAKRLAFVTEQKAKAANAKAEKPTSAQRKPGADTGKQVAEGKVVPTDGKAFAASIRD